MRGAAAFLLLTAAAPQRVASLNLCTDELALALAAPGQLASVTWLAASPDETRLAPATRGLHLNNGRFESVAHLRPDLILTSGPPNRYAAELAQRLRARVLDLAPPDTAAQVRVNIRRLAAALGRPSAGAALEARYLGDLGPQPRRQTPALFLQGGGYTARPDGLAAAYLAHVGLRQQSAGTHLNLERLLVAPPAVLVISTYRANQASLNQRWLTHPALARLPSRRIPLDGRGWTCLGPEAATTLPALRRALNP